MLSLIQQYLLEKNLISPNQRILCGVSGGVDSMVMVDLLLKCKVNIGIAHINHNTRGAESDGDHLFVKNFATEYEIPFFDFTLNSSIKDSPDFQQTARKLRYEFFNKIVTEQGYELIATAHHSDDNIETFFMNLLRGSGLSGLSGIPLIYGNIIRPLKFASRSMIEIYATQQQIDFREDSSNLSDKYLRNDIRHNIVPAIENIKPTARDTINRSISNISSAQSVLKSLVFEKYVNQLDGTLLINKQIPRGDDGITILYTILGDYGFNRNQLKDILESKKGGSKIITPNWTLINDRNHYTLLESVKNVLINITIESEGEYFLSDGRIVVIKESQTKDAFWFTTSPFPLTVRSRLEGDRFRPNGMKGKSKSIKKYLTDIKVESSQKPQILLLEKENVILGIIGYRQSVEVEKSIDKIYGIEIEIILNTNLSPIHI